MKKKDFFFKDPEVRELYREAGNTKMEAIKSGDPKIQESSKPGCHCCEKIFLQMKSSM